MDNAEDKLKSLLKGLLLPDLDTWYGQPSEVFYMTGVVIALKASNAKKEFIREAERDLKSIIIDPSKVNKPEPKIVLLN